MRDARGKRLGASDIAPRPMRWLKPRMPVLKPMASLGPTCVRGEPWMAQYDVFTNPSRSAAEGIPYVVVIQSDLLDALPTRVATPLAELDTDNPVPNILCPVIVINGTRLHALAHYAALLPAKALRRPVGNVAAQASALVSAMNAVLSGVWRIAWLLTC